MIRRCYTKADNILQTKKPRVLVILLQIREQSVTTDHGSIVLILVIMLAPYNYSRKVISNALERLITLFLAATGIPIGILSATLLAFGIGYCLGCEA